MVVVVGREVSPGELPARRRDREDVLVLVRHRPRSSGGLSAQSTAWRRSQGRIAVRGLPPKYIGRLVSVKSVVAFGPAVAATPPTDTVIEGDLRA
ncbi:hypothetical protein JOF44_002215 [Brachybacterium fresconis]|uniref:Uncharacterized protein n=1 Tax=Brachybacterium fresconis TaxID=173363 RepID=A0ABS4YKI6_9MICO|nr:hypothetical protein [Brachybacterium fresconis]